MDSTERFSFDVRTQEILESLTIPFAIYQYIDKRVVTIALSQGFCSEFGFKRLEDAYLVMDNDMYRATHPDDKTRVADAAYRFAAFDAPYDIVYRTLTLKSADYIILHAYGRSIYPEPGVRLCLTWYAYEGIYTPGQGMYESVLNQTLDRFLTEESRYRGVYYDYMTGLPNMSYFYELAEAGRARMRGRGEDSCIMFFDLTGLKHFNRRFGYSEGDHLIQAVARILARYFSSESCARFAQDHFCAFAETQGITERLDAVIAEVGAANDGKTLPIRIGVYPDGMEDVEVGTACDRARLAAELRRHPHESYYAFFDKAMLNGELDRQRIIDTIDQAIDEGWIKVHYQPIVRTASGKVSNTEALARWNDPVRGLLSPAAFIGVLEEAGLIHKLDLYMVRQVLRDLKVNEERGVRSVPVSVNISRADFDACDMVAEICEMVDAAGIERDRICLEITESVVGGDFDYMKGQIERFRGLGFQVWMDDFGSGYSSLDLLQSITVDLIKFNMGFMRQFETSEKSHIILRELMRMAAGIGVDTIVEGVETPQQVRFLREIGCSKMQGFYFSRPHPAETFFELYELGEALPAEDPDEADYFATIGKVNLSDPTGLVDGHGADGLFFSLNVLPMAIVEYRDGLFIVLRCNGSYKEFLRRIYGMDLAGQSREDLAQARQPGEGFCRVARRAIETGEWERVGDDFDGRLAIQSFVRRVAENPKTGAVALVVLVLSVQDKSGVVA